MSEELTPGEEIRELIIKAQNLITEAEVIADREGCEFDLNIGGYGMGGWYSST